MIRTLVRVALVVAALIVVVKGFQAVSARVGEIAPPLIGGTWVADRPGDLPTLIDCRPSGWTVYAFFSPT